MCLFIQLSYGSVSTAKILRLNEIWWEGYQLCQEGSVSVI
jgi:hypothetical protein